MKTNHRNPSRHRLEEHDMLNWLKATRKKMNAGELKADRVELFQKLLELGERYKPKDITINRKYMTTDNTTLFDQEDEERKLSVMGNPLKRLSRMVDIEIFRLEVEDALFLNERKSNADVKRYLVPAQESGRINKEYHVLYNPFKTL